MALYNKSISIVQFRLSIEPGMNTIFIIIIIIVQQTMPWHFEKFLYRKVLFVGCLRS